MKETIEVDHIGLRDVILKAKELEDKIKNVMSKNTAILDFQKNFSVFEDRMDKSISDLYNKTKTMNNKFSSRLNQIDDQNIKIDKRIGKLERDSVIQNQQL